MSVAVDGRPGVTGSQGVWFGILGLSSGHERRRRSCRPFVSPQSRLLHTKKGPRFRPTLRIQGPRPLLLIQPLTQRPPDDLLFHTRAHSS